MLFKVLDDHGVAQTASGWKWPLPQGSRPGKWTDAVNPELCVSGYHGTIHPLAYSGSRLFVFEGRGKSTSVQWDKISFESARLTAEVTPTWPLLKLFPEAWLFLIRAWRQKHPENALPEWADLSRANLSGANLYGANLYGADQFVCPAQYEVDSFGIVRLKQ